MPRGPDKVAAITPADQLLGSLVQYNPETGSVEFLRARLRRIRVYEDARPDFPHEEWGGLGGRRGGLAVLPGATAPPPSPTPVVDPCGGNPRADGCPCTSTWTSTEGRDAGSAPGFWHTVQNGEHRGDRSCAVPHNRNESEGLNRGGEGPNQGPETGDADGGEGGGNEADGGSDSGGNGPF